MYLHEKLEAYEKNSRYPMHMPGHKRQVHEKPYDGDLTEIEGFDNLHHSEGILKSDREKAAEFYGAGEARFLVNGSTCGVLAAISAVTEYGDSILIGRNSHKSAYHAIQLRGLRAEYVYPDASLYQEWSIDGPIPPEAVREILEKAEQMRRKKAVFLTSPTYEGVISDVRKIADICHEYGIPLIVDEAHGAHLKVMGMEGNAVEAGADIAILGLHKTMPVLTQGALLAVSREAIREGRVSMKILDDYLGIYESSSPSYVLMGSISRCVHWLDGSYQIAGRNRGESVNAYGKLLEETRGRLRQMKQLRLFPEGEEKENRHSQKYIPAYDPGKIVISTKKTGITGHELADWLRENDKIEVEMASADYIIAMTSMFDTEEGMRSFAEAVVACDKRLDIRQRPDDGVPDAPADHKNVRSGEFPEAKIAMTIAEATSFARRYPEKVKKKDIYFWMRRKEKDLEFREDRKEEKDLIFQEEQKEEISVEFIYVYPPGIPIIAPGEIITKGVAKKIICDYNSGCALIGCVEKEGKILVSYITAEE